MKRRLAILVPLSLVGIALTDRRVRESRNWSFRADYIEACSCRLFCPCYFYTSPDGGRCCEFNNAVKVVRGHYGNLRLDGLKFWMSGDLGGDFTKGAKVLVLTFEPQATAEQRAAIRSIIDTIYLFNWQQIVEDTSAIIWERAGSRGYARLENGCGEVSLNGVKDKHDQPTIIRNLDYGGAQWNGGFELARSRHRYHGHGLQYEHQNKNGFFLRISSSGGILS